MSFLDFFRKDVSTAVTPDEVRDMILAAMGGGDTTSGIQVGPESALQVSTVFACVRILAESVAQLPLNLYRKDKRGAKSAVNDSSLYECLHWQPNAWQTAFEFLEMLTGHVALRGNGYAFVNRAGGKITELLPFHPDAVTVKQNSDWSLVYKVRMARGVVEEIPAGNMLHIRGMSLNGYLGLSPIAYHKNTVGLALATERHGANLFKNGGRPGGALTAPGKLSKDAAQRIAASWKAAHGGENSGGTAVLEEGLSYESIGMTNEDAQYLETRKFQAEEIARIFRVPPVLLYFSEKANTYASAEQFFLSFTKFTLLPWLRRWEQAIRRDLLTSAEKAAGMYAEFNADGMERGDIKARYEAYGKGIEKGILNPNECRAKENMNPREGGDEYLKPLNMETSGTGEQKTGSVLKTKSEKTGSVDKRNRIRDEFKDQFKAAFQKMVDIEIKAIRKGLNSKSLSGDLEELIIDFYKDFSGQATAAVSPVFEQYAAQVAAAALEDVSTDEVAGLEDEIKGIVEGFVKRWIKSSIGQLEFLIENTELADLASAIETRVSQWDERRADKEAGNEVVQTGNAVARFTWAVAGVKNLVWVNQGSKTCPFCKQLAGKKVGIHKPFLGPGESITASDGSGMKIYGKKAHGPIHRGCKCTVRPE